MIHNKVGKIFFDSGAEINFISSETVTKLLCLQPDIPIYAETYKIKCANGSEMQNKGVIELQLNIAGASSVQKFAIIDNLFPRVIIGMKTMKQIGLKILPQLSGVEINNKFVPFISKVEDTDPLCSVNYRQSSLSAEI